MDQEIRGRCMKCKVNDRLIKNLQITEMAGKGGSKRRAATGSCETCGTKMFKFLPKE